MMPSAGPHAETVDYLSHCTAESWWVAMTRSRFEQRVSGEFQEAGGVAVLPLSERVRLEEDAKGHVHRHRFKQPLFPGYVFLNGDGLLRERVVTSPWVFGVIDVSPAAVPRLKSELSAVLTAAAVDPQIGTTRYCPGTSVFVHSGPFRGCFGFVEEVGSSRLYLRLTQMQASVPVEISPEMVEPAGEN